METPIRTVPHLPVGDGQPVMEHVPGRRLANELSRIRRAVLLRTAFQRIPLMCPRNRDPEDGNHHSRDDGDRKSASDRCGHELSHEPTQAEADDERRREHAPHNPAGIVDKPFGH